MYHAGNGVILNPGYAGYETKINIAVCRNADRFLRLQIRIQAAEGLGYLSEKLGIYESLCSEII